jgi:hypothetical protein
VRVIVGPCVGALRPGQWVLERDEEVTDGEGHQGGVVGGDNAERAAKGQLNLEIFELNI